jgi:predicted nucleotidyltransferase component of viral defense system
MIPRDFIVEWRAHAPWARDFQVEQDLLISRALVDVFSQPEAQGALAFRGGTAIYKIHARPPARYSEDLDLVQISEGPVGGVLDAIRAALDPWLGTPRRRFSEGIVTLVYRAQSEDSPPLPLRLKLEINTMERFSVLGVESHQFTVNSRWFSDSAGVTTYSLDELLGTKMRALYQRRKGRDLFDLWKAHDLGSADPQKVVRCFMECLKRGGLRVSRAQFEENLHRKMSQPAFAEDIPPLVAPGMRWDIDACAEFVRAHLLPLLPGDAWKGMP